MKMLCGALLLGFAVLTASADEVEKRRAEQTGKKYEVYEAANGQVYRNVTITKITDAGIAITHAEGSTRLRFEHLTAQQQKDFGITREGAEAVYAKEMKARAAYEAQLAAKQRERQKANQELLAKQAAALLATQSTEAERAQKQPATTVIESTLEIPAFPIIRGSNNQVLYPVQGYSPFPRTAPQRTHYYGNGSYVYPGGYGGHYYPGNSGGYNSGQDTRYAPARPSRPTPQPRSSFNFTIK